MVFSCASNQGNHCCGIAGYQEKVMLNSLSSFKYINENMK